MEILVPGLILVGFMVWLSTRIKRNAAKAFEREVIETPEFSIVKPEGFLAPVDPEAGFLFTAYSKEFGVDAAERIRKARVEISRFPEANFDDICERVEASSTTAVSKQTGIINEQKCANINVERSENGIAVESFYKIIGGRNAVFQLAVTILPEYKEEFSRKIDELLDSFELT